MKVTYQKPKRYLALSLRRMSLAIEIASFCSIVFFEYNKTVSFLVVVVYNRRLLSNFYQEVVVFYMFQKQFATGSLLNVNHHLMFLLSQIIRLFVSFCHSLLSSPYKNYSSLNHQVECLSSLMSISQYTVQKTYHFLSFY